MPNSTLAQMGFLDSETQQETVYDFEDTQARTDIGIINGKIPSAASSSNKLVDTTAMNDAIGQAVSAAYKPAGNKTVAELTSSLLVAANRGKVYNMTDAGTTTADFVEGAGKPIRIGDDIGICEPTTGTFKFNILSGFIAVDTNPTQSSANPVSSGGVYSALAGKQDEFDIDSMTMEWWNGLGVPDTLAVSTHNYIPQEGTYMNGLPNDTAVRKAVKSAYNLTKDTVGWVNKNLNVLPYIFTTFSYAGVTGTVMSDGSIVFNNTATETISFFPHTRSNVSPADENPIILPAGSYRITKDLNKVAIRVLDTVNGSQHLLATLNKDDTVAEFTLTGTTQIGISIDITSGTAFSNDVLHCMIVKSDILDLTFEPYFGSTAFPRSEQAVLGARNLVKFPYVKLDGSYSAVSVTVNNDGSLLLNGTASTDAFIIFHVRQGASPTDNNPVVLKAGTYNVYKGDNANDVSLRLNKTVNGNAVTLVELSGSTKKGTFTLTEETQIGMIIDITNGTVVTNNVVKPMITFGDDKNETITPYAMTNRELTENVTPKNVTVQVGTDIELRPANMAKVVGNLLCLNLVLKNTGSGNKTSSDTLVTISGLNVTHSNNLVCLGVKTGDGTPKAFLLTHNSSTNTIVVKVLSGNFASDETCAINFVEAL